MGFKDKFMNAINTIDKAVNTSVPLNKAPSSSDYTFILKSHFKGFKSFPIVVYSSTNKEALINNSRLSDPLPGKEIKPYPSEFNKNKNEQRIKIFVKYKDN